MKPIIYASSFPSLVVPAVVSLLRWYLLLYYCLPHDTGIIGSKMKVSGLFSVEIEI